MNKSADQPPLSCCYPFPHTHGWFCWGFFLSLAQSEPCREQLQGLLGMKALPQCLQLPAQAEAGAGGRCLREGIASSSCWIEIPSQPQPRSQPVLCPRNDLLCSDFYAFYALLGAWSVQLWGLQHKKAVELLE